MYSETQKPPSVLERHAPPGNGQRLEAPVGNRSRLLHLRRPRVRKLQLEAEASCSTWKRQPSRIRPWKLRCHAQPANIQRSESATGNRSLQLHKRTPEAWKPQSESSARNVSAYRRNTAAATFENRSAAPEPSAQPTANVVPLVRGPPARAAVFAGAFVPRACRGACKPPLDAHAVKGGASSPRLRKPRARRLPPIGKQSGACLAPHVRVQPRRLCPRGLWLR